MAAIGRLHRVRHTVQAVVVVLVLGLAVRHGLEQPGAASVDALCPFGGVETLWTWVTTGSFVTKIHPANLVLAGLLAVSVLVAGNAFCGWVCPLGSLQDGIAWLRRRLRLRAVTVAPRVDRVLRWGRFVVLAVILVVSAQTATLWFAGWDPYVTIFGLHWLLEPEPASMWVGWTVALGVLGIGLLVERAWCRYLCPLGGVLSVLGHLSILRIRRTDSCTGCDLCVRPCPVGIDVGAAAPAVSTDCIGCLECVASCPTGGALSVQAGTPWSAWRGRPAGSGGGRKGGPGAGEPVPVTIGRRRPGVDRDHATQGEGTR